jgi:hypothetical protein
VYCRVCGRELPRGSRSCKGCGAAGDTSASPRAASVQVAGIDRMTGEELASEVQRGGRFLIFQFCASTFVMAYRTSSDVFFYRAGESAAREIFHYCLASMLLGWWGLPWGPIFTIRSIIPNLRGGRDVTQEVVTSLKKRYAQ